MEAFRTIIISILMVVLAFSLISFQLCTAINATLLQPDFYNQVLEGQHFYDQIRQCALKQMQANLRFSPESLPYLENALTENWIQSKSKDIISGIITFIKGQRNELPIIPFYELKEQLISVMNKPLDEKEQLIEYWFAGMPNRVRVEDFTSTDILWKLRNLTRIIPLSIYIIIVSIIILSYLATFNFKQTTLSIGSALTAAGGLSMGLGLALKWGISSYDFIPEWNNIFSFIGLPEKNVEILVRALADGLVNKAYTMAMIFTLMGLLIIYIMPLKEESQSM